jgi:hypothetical protein
MVRHSPEFTAHSLPWTLGGIFTVYFLLFIFLYFTMKGLYKILYNLILNFFLSDLLIFKEQLILNSYKKIKLKGRRPKWKTQQARVAYHKFWKICILILKLKQSRKLYNFSPSKLFQFYFGTKNYFCYFLVIGWEEREIKITWFQQ